MTDQVWTSHLRIAGGNAVEDAPQIAFSERRDRRGRLVRIYLLAESASSAGDNFIETFVARVGEAFDPTRRSLTGALTEALEDRHEELRHWNREHLPAQQVSYGVSCAILREGDAGILAQAGPSLAVLAGDPTSGLRELQVRAHRGDDPVAQPIGGSGALAVQFFPMPTAADGWALLLTSNAARLVDAAGRVGLGRLAVDDVLRNLYPGLREFSPSAALVIALPPGEGAPSSGRRSAPEVPGALGGESPSGESASPDPTVAPRSDAALDVGRDLVRDGGPDVARTELETAERVEADARPAGLRRLLQRGAAAEPAADPDAETSGRDHRLAGLGAGVAASFSSPPALRGGWPSNPFAVVDLPVLAVAAGPAAPPPSWERPLMNLADEIPASSAHRPELERKTKRRAPPLRTALLALGLMAIVLAGVAAALLLPTLLSRGDEQFSQQIEQARQGLAAAALGVDLESSRASLRQARGDVNLALEHKPLDQQALDLRVEIEAALAELELVVVPTELSTLVDLGRFGPSIALGTVRRSGERLYALDDAGGRVFSISPEGVASVVFTEGAALDAAGERRAARPISLAPDGEALWVLDSAGQLFRLERGGALLIGLPELERLGSLDAIAVSDSGLWVLDARGGAVWLFPRTAPEERLQLGAPSRMTPRTDLAAGTEIAIAAQSDGSVAILITLSDGRLRRFVDQEERPLTLEGLDREPLAPASISVGDPSGLIYLADRGNDRVLILGPDGALSRQIAAEQLRGVRGVAVDEASGRLIYAFESVLLTSPLPTADDQPGS